VAWISNPSYASVLLIGQRVIVRFVKAIPPL
jgi:hypothetical protein